MNAESAKDIIKQFKDFPNLIDGAHPNAKAYFLAEGYMDCYKKLRPLAGHEIGCHHNFAINPECTCDRKEAIK